MLARILQEAKQSYCTTSARAVCTLMTRTHWPCAHAFGMYGTQQASYVWIGPLSDHTHHSQEDAGRTYED